MASKPFDTFCYQVCSLIRWKPARYAAWTELNAHLEDHAAALEKRGMESEEAARRAVEAMGDPYKLGHQLDKCHSPLVPRLSRIFALSALVVLLLSLVIGFRAGTGLFALSGVFPQPESLLDQDCGTLEVSGSAVGGGQLSGYQISPSGEAGLVLLSLAYPEEEPRQEYLLRCPLIITQWQFWKPPMNFLRGELSWTDDTGGTGSAIISEPVKHGLLGSSTVLELQNPTPGARQFTLTLNSPEESVTIYITLQEEVPPL